MWGVAGRKSGLGRLSIFGLIVADWHWQAAHDKQGEVGGFLSMLSDALADADCPRMETVLKSAIQAQHEAVAALDELKDP